MPIAAARAIPQKSAPGCAGPGQVMRVLALIVFVATMAFMGWGVRAGAADWGWAFPAAIFALELFVAVPGVARISVQNR